MARIFNVGPERDPNGGGSDENNSEPSMPLQYADHDEVVHAFNRVMGEARDPSAREEIEEDEDDEEDEEDEEDEGYEALDPLTSHNLTLDYLDRGKMSFREGFEFWKSGSVFSTRKDHTLFLSSTSENESLQKAFNFISNSAIQLREPFNRRDFAQESTFNFYTKLPGHWDTPRYTPPAEVQQYIDAVTTIINTRDGTGTAEEQFFKREEDKTLSDVQLGVRYMKEWDEELFPRTVLWEEAWLTLWAATLELSPPIYACGLYLGAQSNDPDIRNMRPVYITEHCVDFEKWLMMKNRPNNAVIKVAHSLVEQLEKASNEMKMLMVDIKPRNMTVDRENTKVLFIDLASDNTRLLWNASSLGIFVINSVLLLGQLACWFKRTEVPAPIWNLLCSSLQKAVDYIKADNESGVRGRHELYNILLEMETGKALDLTNNLRSKFMPESTSLADIADPEMVAQHILATAKHYMEWEKPRACLIPFNVNEKETAWQSLLEYVRKQCSERSGPQTRAMTRNANGM